MLRLHSAQPCPPLAFPGCTSLTAPPPPPPPPRHRPGCIFHYDDDKFKQGSGVGFKESDTPNFTGSYYSKTKAMVEDLLRVGGVGWAWSGVAGRQGVWRSGGA